MSFAVEKWFNFVQQGLLTEGIDDIGLEPKIVENIKTELSEASEKSRVWLGNAWKFSDITRFARPRQEWKRLRKGVMDRQGELYQKGEFNILENFLNAIETKPIKDWKKAKKGFLKQATRMGIEEKRVRFVINAYESFLKHVWNDFKNKNYNTIQTLNLDSRNYEQALLFDRTEEIQKTDPETGLTRTYEKYFYDSISDFPPTEWEIVEKKTEKFIQDREDPDQVVLELDYGFYWYDLNTYSCKREKERMGHCGTDDRGHLYSLRKKKQGRLESTSFVTISYNTYNETIFQIKGRFNEAPAREYWEYIAEFIDDMGAEKLQEMGEHAGHDQLEDFKQMAEFLEERTGIEIDSEEKRLEEFRQSCEGHLQNFRQADYSEHILLGGLTIDITDWDDPRPMWHDSVVAVSAEIFEDRPDLEDFAEPLAEMVIYNRETKNKLLDALNAEDRNNLFYARYIDKPVPILLAADSLQDSLQKAYRLRYDGLKNIEKYLNGSKYYLVFVDVEEGVREYVNEYGSVFFDDTTYDTFLDTALELAEDLEDAVESIQEIFTEMLPESEEDDEEVRELGAGLRQKIAKLQAAKKEIEGKEGLRDAISAINMEIAKIKRQLADLSERGLFVNEAVNPLDVRLYEIEFVMSYPLGLGFEITDIHNIIRAIPDVTTIRSIGYSKKTQGNRTVSLQRCKFALQGLKRREEWVKKVLLPQIHKIDHRIRLHRVNPAKPASKSKKGLREVYYNTSMRQSPGRTTPRPAIQGVIDDWVEGGVMYDSPTNINLSRYSVMMLVSDLAPYLSRIPRKHGHHFDAAYQKFIENGPRDPIYLAIGKNGRAKITGNEDELRYALKAGVEEVPVFISYQRQI